MQERGFQLVYRFKDEVDLLPKRATQHSAGYDLKAAETTTIPPRAIALISTGVKAYMMPGEVLQVYDRSSNPRKKRVALANSVGIIDADYYNNPDNEGEIFAQFINLSDEEVVIQKGDAIMQGIFLHFLLADDDNATGSRVGGFGSTGN